MKLIQGNGKELTVRDCGEPLMRLAAVAGGMVKFHGSAVVSDEKARDIVRNILADGCERVL